MVAVQATDGYREKLLRGVENDAAHLGDIQKSLDNFLEDSIYTPISEQPNFNLSTEELLAVPSTSSSRDEPSSAESESKEPPPLEESEEELGTEEEKAVITLENVLEHLGVNPLYMEEISEEARRPQRPGYSPDSRLSISPTPSAVTVPFSEDEYEEFTPVSSPDY